MGSLGKIPISVLDLVPIIEGGTATESFKNSIDLAQHAERLGYNRVWFAEHHSMPGIASAATSIVIGRVAAETTSIRVGAGGIMLPNHAPLVIAEQFATLEAMFPGRIDLGLGRAPGSDRAAAHALRRSLDADDFPQQLQELEYFLRDSVPNQRVRAVPTGGSQILIWLLGSSGFSAQLAGQLGMPFSFAAHFSPENLEGALKLYRENFRPSEALDEPYVMVALNVFAGESEGEAERLATSQHQSFINLVRGTPAKIKPPVDDMDAVWTLAEKSMVQQRMGGSIIGGREKVRRELQAFQDLTKADELIVHAMIYDHAARLRSYEIVAEVMREENADSAAGK
ncbi:MAG: LLM class flavin-dependent oxidoreductase [bacterium]|nr:LLM class flavin-dependent oxidoreductase [bacterium]